MLVSRYIVYFYIYSFMGWVYETIAMTIWTKKWDNRGFLFEPILPIYGIGAVGITGIVEYCSVNGIVWTWKHLFVVAFFGSIILEYFTGWFLEKVFHAYWWTYSNVPFNVKGRVFTCINRIWYSRINYSILHISIYKKHNVWL